jgi:hypothetical protein
MRRREHIPGFKKCQTARYASRYSDRAVNGCTRALPAVRSVLGHQADSGGQSILFRFVDSDVWKLACFL